MNRLTKHRALSAVIAALWVLFAIDCALLTVGMTVAARHGVPDYAPAGGVSILVIVLLIGLARRVRDGRDYPYP